MGWLTPSDVRADRAVTSVLSLLGARNLGELVLPGAAYVPTNVAVGAAMLAVARGSGSSWAELGLDRRHLRLGLTVGGATGAGAVTAMLVAASLPPTRRVFDDERVPREASAYERLYQIMIRIPIGTVMFEELAFRGVLLSVLQRCLQPPAAAVIDSALFGLWHIVPTLATARANQIVGLARLGFVAGSVLATTAGGAVLCALRCGPATCSHRRCCTSVSTTPATCWHCGPEVGGPVSAREPPRRLALQNGPGGADHPSD